MEKKEQGYPTFKFKDLVRITNGFYAGEIGRVTQEMVSPIYPNSYTVRLDDAAMDVRISADDLTLETK